MLLLYLNDVLVISSTFEQHKHRLEEVLLRLRKARLKLKLSKCKMLKRKARYSSHIITEDGVATDPSRELRVYLGTVDRKYVADVAMVSRQPTRLTSKGEPLGWGRERGDTTWGF